MIVVVWTDMECNLEELTVWDIVMVVLGYESVSSLSARALPLDLLLLSLVKVAYMTVLSALLLVLRNFQELLV